MSKTPDSDLILKRNLEALYKRYPDLASKIDALEEDRSYRLVSSAHPQLPNLFFTRNGNSGTYYDNDDPLRYSVDYINSLHLKNSRIVILFGLGLGYQLAYFAQHLARPLGTKNIIVVEEDLSVFKNALKAVDLTPYILSPDIEFYVGLEPVNIFTLFKKFVSNDSRGYLLRTIKFITMPAAHLLGRLYYLKALKAIKDACKAFISSTGNDPYDALLGLENLFGNILTVTKNPGINRLYETFKDRPGVVIATGPSLSNNMHLLKAIEKKALLLSVDASLRVLMAKGITPHLVTSIERVPGIAPLLRHINYLDNVYYAACDIVQPDAFEAYSGPKITVSRAYSYYDWLEIEKGQLSTGPSTANLAYKIAEVLGCNPIILVGQDLCLGEDGYTHATGALPNQKIQDVKRDEYFEVPGNSAQTVLTTKVWYNFLKHYEYDISNYNGLCINATEGGARIDGARVMKLADAINTYCRETFDPVDVIKKNLSAYKIDMKEELKGLFYKVEKARDAMARLIHLCKKGIDLIDEFDQKIYLPLLIREEERLPEKEDIRDYADQVFRLTKEIIDEKFTNQILRTSLQAYHLPFEMEKSALLDRFENPTMADIASIHSTKEWFATIGQLVISTKHCIRRGRQNIDHLLKKELSS